MTPSGSLPAPRARSRRASLRLALPLLALAALASGPLRADRDRSPRSGHDWYSRGMHLHNSERYEEAIEAFRKSIGLGYREGASTYNIACGYALLGRKAEALDALEKSIAAGYDDPGHIDSDDDLDGIRREPRFREIRRMAEDLELPGSWDGMGHRGLGRLFNPDWRRPLRRYQDFLKDHPESGRAWFNVGFAELKLDHPHAAVDAFKKAYERGYRKATSQYNLACSYARIGRNDEAFDWLFKAIDAGFDSAGTMRHDDDLDELHGDPRWRKALRAIERNDREDDDD